MNAAVLLTVAVLVGLAIWLAHSWWWPFKGCSACNGRSGRGAGSGRAHYNRCRKCKGNPELTRVGARLISAFTGQPVRGSDKRK